MARRVRQLAFPSWLANTPFELKIKSSELSEDGEPKNIFCTSGVCIFSEKIKRVYDKDGKYTLTAGKVLIEGDIAPSITDFSQGEIYLHDKKHGIFEAARPRNPDGTVHHTELTLK